MACRPSELDHLRQKVKEKTAQQKPREGERRSGKWVLVLSDYIAKCQNAHAFSMVLYIVTQNSRFHLL